MALKLNEQQLKDIERMAGYFFTTHELAIIIGCDADDLEEELGNPRSNITKAVMKGRLQAEADIRASVFDLAKHGSAPAQAQALDMIERFKDMED